MTRTSKQLRCACGHVQLVVEGAPIVSVECHCNSCRAAGSRMGGLPAAPRFLRENGATPFVLYRKDRVRFASGHELLKELRLTPASESRRVIATCCNTPVLLELANAHWLSLYACLWPAGTAPAIEMGTMTSDLPPGVLRTGDVPSGRWQTVRFYGKLLAAWAAMGFRAPKVEIGGVAIDPAEPLAAPRDAATSAHV